MFSKQQRRLLPLMRTRVLNDAINEKKRVEKIDVLKEISNLDQSELAFGTRKLESHQILKRYHKQLYPDDINPSLNYFKG